MPPPDDWSETSTPANDAPSPGIERPVGGLPVAPSGRVPTWVYEEAARAQAAGTRPNYGVFVDGAPGSSGPGYLGGTNDPAGRYELPGHGGAPRRSLTSRLGAIGVAVALALAVIFVAADSLRTTRVPPELLGSYAERTDLPTPLGLTPARNRPATGFGEEPSPLGQPPQVDSPSDAWAYRELMPTDGESEPVLWSPCRPIHYVVNTAGAPDDFLVYVTRAVEEVSAATGLVFHYDGTTHEPLTPDREPFLPLLYGDRWAPVLIGWADDRQVAALDGDVAGLAYSRVARDPTRGTAHTVSGQIVLDLTLRTLTQRNAYVGVLRHELGHLVGLDHIEDETQIMHAHAHVNTFQRGDLTGLAAVGAGPCAPGL